MSPNSFSPMFHIDVTAEPVTPEAASGGDKQDMQVVLLRHLVLGQERQNKLLEELIQQAHVTQRQRAQELGQWKAANPGLARKCKVAAETLSRVQNEFLHRLTEEIADNEDGLLEGEFMLSEFVDRYGPRLAHLNGVLQALAQLSFTPEAASSPRQ